MPRRLGGAAGAAVIVALVLHLMSPAAPAADVTTQVAPFRLKGTVSAACFMDAAVSALGDLALSSTVVEAATSVLVTTRTSVVLDVEVDGDLSIQRHGQNGAVHHLAWSASLTQGSLALTATTTNASATVCARATSASMTPVVEVPRVGESSMALETAGAFAAAGVATSSSASSNYLATAMNLTTVDAMNIKEARSLIVFRTDSFVMAENTV